MSDEMLAERMARLEERMKTMQAEYKTDIALLARQWEPDFPASPSLSTATRYCCARPTGCWD